MKTIKVTYSNDIPTKFTGIAEYTNGDKSWYKKGKIHRLGAPAVEYANGNKYWWVENKLHRLGGPALDCVNGHKEWYNEGKYHRLGGPAIEWTDGHKEWYVNDKKITELEHDLLYSIMKLKNLI